MSLIRLQVPGSLEFRDLAVRVVAAACKLVSSGPAASTTRGQSDEPRAEFDNQVISAFGEAFNNAAIHSYRGRPLGTVEIEIEIEPQRITLRICDYGVSFDPTQVEAPDLDSMPESGMGLFIMRSFMDSVFYKAGAPNVLSMTKQLHPEVGAAQEGGAP